MGEEASFITSEVEVNYCFSREEVCVYRERQCRSLDVGGEVRSQGTQA